MAWQKQTSFKKGKPIEEEKPKIPNEIYYRKFLEDWENCRDRHPGQKEVLEATFEHKFQYIFYRAGRKGAKTTTAIDIAWKFAHMIPKSVGYLCYPTIAQGIEVVWEERRLQTCDRKDDEMFLKYVEKTDDSRHILWFSNGSFIKLIGTWTEARGRGTQPDYLICDEFQDCNPDYIEAMDANLAAKNSPCILMGTPPKKKNHYEEWLARVENNPKGKTFHFTSYDNVRLPHLKEWLDNKKTELIKAGKEDVWLREYMAELCYSSSDRVLPDIKFMERNAFYKNLGLFNYAERSPILAISIHPTYFCAIFAILNKSKNVFIFDHKIVKNVWNKAFTENYTELGEKVLHIQELCGRRIQNIVWDESGSFVDVVGGFSKCRKDIKWQDRGIPLLREMIVKEKILFLDNVADLGVECQNLLVEEPEKEIQKNYPLICTLSMMVNEFFSQEKLTIPLLKPFDKFEAFREMGIPVPPKKRPKRFFGLN